MKNFSQTYFIYAPNSNLIKIGTSTRFRQRFKEIQTASPEHLVLIGVVSGIEHPESFLHYTFRLYRVHGEWFENCLPINSFCKNLFGNNCFGKNEKDFKNLSPFIDDRLGAVLQHIRSKEMQ
jgi:uncharacterized protein YozE (UPF0346 family)